MTDRAPRPLRALFSRRRAGFTLIEVMIAVIILAVGLSSLFTSQIGAVRIAQRARMTTIASLLARCKMAELEEKVAKEGWPATDVEGNDECCEGAERAGFTCDWSIKRIVLPDLAPEGEGTGEDALEQVKAGAGEAVGTGTTGSSPMGAATDPINPLASVGVPLTGGIDTLLSGGGDTGGGDPLAQLVMSYAFPVMKPLVEEQVRRATVVVKWNEGSGEQSFDVVQYLVNELPILAADEDEEAEAGGSGSGAGTGTGTGTGTSGGQSSGERGSRGSGEGTTTGGRR